MKKYDHNKIEKKWQREWEKKKLYKTADRKKGADNFNLLTEFPYPSGNLHVGHWYAFSIPDILARYMRMQGKNVLYPIGFDAFGLPAENAAIKNKLNPRKWTEKNIAYMKKQIRSMGTMFDWSREVQTIDPAYYKWTQWMFLQFFKKDLAYQKDTPVNWCPSCKTVLANEQVVDGACERCKTEVVQKQMLQWNLKITEYADRLVDDLEKLDWPEPIKDAQRAWIGRSEGAEIEFPLEDHIKRIVLLHGKGGSADGAFKPKLKVRLEKLGYEVHAPQLPNTDEPNDYEQAEYVKKNVPLDLHTAVVGHSFGGVVALRLLERGVKLGRVTLLATPFSGVYADRKARPTVTVALERGYNWEAIRSNCKSFLALYDIDDHVVPISDGEAYAKKLDCYMMKVHSEKSHFNGPNEPEVFRAAIPSIRVFTTRADTLFGATYMVLAPEHPWVKLALMHKTVLKNNGDVQQYVNQSAKKTELERQEQKEKTGVELKGVKAINPASGEKIPLYVADYVLGHYGTGAIMAVPAHDERDFAFAKKFDIPVVQVVESKQELPYTGEGVLMNSGEYSGAQSFEARKMMTEKFGVAKKTYKMRDWIVSRQRYWGVPIPIIHCAKCGAQPVPDKDLPVKLPEIKDYLPDGRGKSPLAKARKWVAVKCPKCKGAAERETDTLDTFVDSSWYFLRYTDPKNRKQFADSRKQSLWMPINLYSGGAEHTTMHVLYSRFWQKVLFDLGLVADAEPYTRRMNRSLILGPDGQKMSKSRGNVIDPDAVVERLGADTVRMYLAFIGPYNEISSYPWNPDGVVGVRRFLERVGRAADIVQKVDVAAVDGLLHKTIKKVGEDIAAMKFNTAIAQLMIFLNAIEKHGVGKEQWGVFLRLLAPFAPHITEELSSARGTKKSIHLSRWPAYDVSKLKEETTTMAVQVNGKTRGTITAPADSEEKEVRNIAEREEIIVKYLGGNKVAKVIYVKNRLLNFVLANNP